MTTTIAITLELSVDLSMAIKASHVGLAVGRSRKKLARRDSSLFPSSNRRRSVALAGPEVSGTGEAGSALRGLPQSRDFFVQRACVYAGVAERGVPRSLES